MANMTWMLNKLSSPSVDPSITALSATLQMPIEELTHFRLNHRYYYRPLQLTKPDGRPRMILAPSEPLKQLQRNLLKNYLQGLPIHASTLAFRRGKSIVDSAYQHANAMVLLTTDISDFFAATTAARVRSYFVKQGWCGLALEVLLQLCTFQGSLPQGAPTSPALSNLVNRSLDQRLQEIALINQATYTRYCDDLAFSAHTQFSIERVCIQVEEMLNQYGYQIQPKKGWQLQHPQRAPATMLGLQLYQGKLRMPTSIRRKIWYLRVKQWLAPNQDTMARLRGYQALQEMIER